jgi:predicted RNA binding protein YcfA (HicA-like mRNA interferase family)
MSSIAEMVLQMKNSPGNVRFADLCMVCDHFFGAARQKGSSHRIYKTPWQGDPRINIQSDKGKAKSYQVKQVIKAIEILEVNYGIEE